MTHIEIYVLPLLFIFSILGLLLILTLHLFTQTKKYLYLGLAGAFLISTLLGSFSLNPSSSQFLSITFTMPIIGMLLSVIAVRIILNTRDRLNWITGIVFISLALITLVIPFHHVFLSLLMLVYAAISLWKGRWSGSITLHFVQSIFFILLGLLGLIGAIQFFAPVAFLYSFLALVQTIMTVILFFDRVVMMMRVASYNSITDPLTGIYNKRFMLHKVKTLAGKQKISIIFADIDNFKQLNDTKGHDEGDRVLKEIATYLKQTIGKNGFACRFGGEEMVGIVTRGDAAKMAEAFRRVVEKQMGVTLSIGVASGEGDGDKIIKEADENMYIAKNSGKNKVVSQKETIA